MRPMQRVARSLITYLMTLAVLSVFGLISFGVRSLKQRTENENSSQSHVIMGLTLITSVIVVLINLVLSSVVFNFTIYERHNTFTNHRLSVASKLTLVLFTNTALIPFFVN